jgi:hypothetical protein
VGPTGPTAEAQSIKFLARQVDRCVSVFTVVTMYSEMLLVLMFFYLVLS